MTSNLRSCCIGLVALVGGLTACGDDADRASPTTSAATAPTTTGPTTTGPTTTGPTTSGPTTTGSTAPAPPAARSLDEVSIALEPVATFDVPTAYRPHPDGSGWITEKSGTVRSFETGALVLDIRDEVVDRGEQGMLGLAFGPEGSHLYVSYSDARDDGAGVVDEYAFSDGAVDPASRREIIRVAQPYSNHNGGNIVFGPDGHLWFGLGDGGSAGDPHENGQDTGSLLGSILRIDPSRPSDGRAYGIPPDNPFVNGGGRPEIWSYGARNPWRFAFDPATQDLWVADVGQNSWEEINVLRSSDGRGRGVNLGWNGLEGTHVFDAPPPPEHVLPVFEYSHDEGCSITGGPVYRGTDVPGLDGAYLFGDFCRPTVRAIRVEGPETVEARTFPVDAGPVISFGVEPSGEVLVLSQEGTVYRIVPG